MDSSDIQGDETVSLSDVLVARDACLQEDELWALCRECCLVLEVVNNSPDQFQTLCVTPDTVAFDQVGNVCFLDLDVDPEPIYMSPEYSKTGNTYKTHLFSLGMTLLYAAEYNVDQSKETVSPELRELLGCMTTDSSSKRPDLEYTIILCEEQLCGQSSQEVCCGIAAVVGFGAPSEDILNEDLIDDNAVPTTYPTQGSATEYSQLDSVIQSESADATFCDDIPDLTEDISLAESLPVLEHCAVMTTESAKSKNDTMALTEYNYMGNEQKLSNGQINMSQKQKQTLPTKPESLCFKNSTEQGSLKRDEKRVHNCDVVITELLSESDTDHSRNNSDNSQLAMKTKLSDVNQTSLGVGKTDSKGKDGTKDVTKHSTQNLTAVKYKDNQTSKVESNLPQTVAINDKHTSNTDVIKGQKTDRERLENLPEHTSTFERRNKRKQSLTITDILAVLKRSLKEDELWALCKEGIAALQRKKKNIPAYLSPDTLVIRESGTVSFKAIPEEKPLEVIFMAPELQKKGELSEKTCLYGLSVTLRCAAGSKYSLVTTLDVSQDLKDLLQYLADSNPNKRPELVDIAKICSEHINEVNSDSVCAKLFKQASQALMDKEELALKRQLKDISTQRDPSKNSPLIAFKPTVGSSFQPVKPTAVGSNLGALCPVPKKPESNTESSLAKPRLPSAFSSPATHFKPIILQQIVSPDSSEKPATVSDEKISSNITKENGNEKSLKPSPITSSKTSSPDPNNDKEKEVVKKLRELKKNLMKHKQPSMAKEIENEDKLLESSKEGSNKSSTPSKKSLPPLPKKSGTSRNTDGGTRRKSSGALDALLKEIQKQGNLPDTNSLASAIAQYLQNHLSKTEKAAHLEKPKGQVELDMTVTSAQVNFDQLHTLPSLNIPTQYHSQLVGQTIPLPIQYGGGVYSGLPQFQFQQDPITGFLQLVPVTMVPLRPQSVHSNGGSAHSVRDFTSPLGSGELPKDTNSPKVYHNPNDVSTQNIIADPPGSRSKASHGRTAKDLVQKTANVRAKNVGRRSPTNVLTVPSEASNLYKWKSDRALDRSETNFYTDNGRVKHMSYSSLAYPNKLSTEFMYDDSVSNANQCRNVSLTIPSRPHSGSSNLRSPDVHYHPINSNTSSPSPSAHDSGIGGMNHGGFRSLPLVSDTTLMDRLLGNVNVKQQRILGRVVHLLREEFAFDVYVENGVEDLAIAEYIASLGVLKWDTFKNAVIEKYSDMYWNDELLSNLYAAVNDNRLVSGNRNNKGQERETLGPKSMKQDNDLTNHLEHNEGVRKMNHDGSQNQSPVITAYQRRQRLSNQIKEAKQLDSSDTDTDSYKNYRVKTKHDSDKTKSYTKKVVPEDLILIVADKEAPPVPVNSNSDSTSLPGQTDTQGLPTVPSFSENITQSSNPHLSIDTSHKKSPVPQTITLRQHSLHIQHHLYNNYFPYNNYFVSNDSASPRGVGWVPQLSRETSISSHGSSHSDLKEGESTLVDRKGHVVYHWAMIQLSMSTEMEYFMQDIDEQNGEKLLSKLSSLEQQIKMEKRIRKKMQNFYKSLLESVRNVNDATKVDRSGKGEKNQLLQVAKDITDMTNRITCLDLCKTHIQMLLAELQGIDISYLHSIAICAPGEPLQLHPRPDNPLLQFQTLREPRTGCEIQALHAGTPEGLMAYLFASTALSDGFMHQFLYCFRYFTTAEDVLSFLINKYISATRSGSTETNISRLQHRVLDFLQYWLEGFYSIDFNDRPVLINALRDFIREHVNEDSESGHILLRLLSKCCSGNNFELTSADPDESEMHFWQRDVPKFKWEFIKNLMRGKSSKKDKVSKVTISAVCVERRQRSLGIKEAGPLKYHSCRTDMFMLADYTSSCLAEQLCLIEQGLFQLTHPVHYLDSKCRGVGVALTMNRMRTPAVTRRCNTEDGTGLFLEPVKDSIAVQKMIEHAQEVSHWVAGEIVACSNSKTQQAVLSKFLHIAHACVQLSNFATGMAILDGLENLIIKQLPAWKNLPAKCSSIMEELRATKMFLKNDALSLMQQGNECHLYPTIPSVVFFLLHIQQLEIGGFKLANQMFKWGKIRSITQVMDQIRIYREHIYGFEADHTLQDILQQRIHEMATKDIDIIAVQHDIKISSNSGISGAFKKMKEKFK